MKKSLSNSILLTFLLISIIPASSHAQNGEMSAHWKSFLKFQEFQGGGLNDSALFYLNEASIKAFETDNYNRFLWYMNETGRYLYIKGYPNRAIDSIRSGMRKFKTHADTSKSVMYSYCYNGIGFILYSQKQLKKASRYFIQNIKHTEQLVEQGIYYNKTRESSISQLLSVYSTIVTCYSSIYIKTNDQTYFHLAVDYALKAWDTVKREEYEAGYVDVIKSYSELIQIAYPIEVVRLMELETKDYSAIDKLLYYKNLSKFYNLQGKNDKAIKLLKQAEEIRKLANNATTQDKITSGFESGYENINSIANIYLQKGMTDSASALYSRTIEFSKDPLIIVEAYRGLAKSHLQKGQQMQADSLYQKAIDLLNTKKEPATHIEYLLERAVVNIKMNRLDSARMITKRAIAIQNHFVNETLPEEYAGNLSYIFNYRFALARIYGEIYLLKGGEDDYQKAQKHFTEGLILANQLNYKLVNKTSLAYLSKNMKRYLPFYVEINYKKYTHTGDERYVDNIIDALANNKSRTLNTLISKARVNPNNATNDNAYRKIDSLEFEINQLETAILNTSDTSRLKSYKKEKLTKVLDLLSIKLKTERSGAAKKPVYSLNTGREIQENLDKNTLLIDYYLTDSVLFSVGISNTSYHINRTTLPADFKKLVSNQKRTIKTGGTINNEQERLNQILLSQQLNAVKDKKRLIIIPDEYLFDLPFETLPHKNAPLIKNYTVSYQYSSLQKALKQPKSRTKEYSSLIVAPDFSSKGNYNLRSTYNEADTNSSIFRNGSLVELPYAREEALAIKKQFEANSLPVCMLVDKMATKENFINNAREYQILHLATHGYDALDNPFLSRIYFSESTPNKRPKTLIMNELYNLSLEADLAVLSACKSGKGMIIEGEGMLALPGGFIYAGVPNVIASLWKVHDEKTKELMMAFYKHLLENKLSYAEALREAKLECMKKGFLPIDWAGFVLIGG